MAKINLKFYKKAYANAPTGAAGVIWFDSTNKRIKLFENNAWVAYGSNLKDASFTNNTLTITRVDGASVSVDLSVYAKTADINTIVSNINTQFSTIDANYQTIAGKVSGLETTTSEANAKIAALEEAAGKVSGNISSAITNAINALDKTVQSNGNDKTFAVPTGSHVAVQVVEENGLLKSVSVLEKDIASASTVSSLSSTVSNLSDAIDIINGDDAGSSIRDIAIDVLTETLVKEGADAAYDTLQEVSNWIKSHPQEAATMNSDIATLKTNVQTLQNKTVVDSFGGKTGAIKLTTGSTTNGTVNFGLTDDKTLTGTVYGLGTLAYKSSLSKSDVGLGNVDNTAAKDYFTGLTSNTTNAVSITVGGTTKSITAATMKTSFGLKSAAYAETSAFDAAGAATTAANTMASTLKGKSGDAASAETIAGAKAYADNLFTWEEYD